MRLRSAFRAALILVALAAALAPAGCDRESVAPPGEPVRSAARVERPSAQEAPAELPAGEEPASPEGRPSPAASSGQRRGPDRAAIAGSDERLEERTAMVANHIRCLKAPYRRAVDDPDVLQAMLDVPRHRFVPDVFQRAAYNDRPLGIGLGQTISQPYIVALMTEAASIQPGEKVLEVGTGSGYGAAVASRIASEVYTIEIIEDLAESARKRLAELGFENVHVRAGDGYRGWPEHAPFDAVIVTAAPDHVPQPLKEQLAEGGRLVIPVGPQGGIQKLVVITRTGDGFREEILIAVRFVPMTGEAEKR